MRVSYEQLPSLGNNSNRECHLCRFPPRQNKAEISCHSEIQYSIIKKNSITFDMFIILNIECGRYLLISGRKGRHNDIEEKIEKKNRSS